MTIKQLAYRGLPQIAVAVGATTPNPGALGVQVWSTSTSSVLVWNGTSWQVLPYAISNVTGLQTALDAKVAKAGDTMQGPLNIDMYPPVGDMERTTLQYNKLERYGAGPFGSQVFTFDFGVKPMALNPTGRVDFSPKIVANSGVDISGSGNLNFLASSQRFLADFSNATISNRLIFQTNTATSNTSIWAIPTNTYGSSSWTVGNAQDPNNCGFCQIQATTTESRINSNSTGSGTAIPFAIWVGGSERMRIGTDGQVLVGTTSGSGYKLTVANGDANKKLYMTTDVSSSFSYSDGNYYFGCTGATAIAAVTGNLTRMTVEQNGNINVGYGNYPAAGNGRYFDIYNLENTNTSSSALTRLQTMNLAGSAVAQLDIIKYKAGSAYLNNTETNLSNSLIAISIAGNERFGVMNNYTRYLSDRLRKNQEYQASITTPPSTQWYRLCTLPATNQGQYVEFIFTMPSVHLIMKVTFSKTTWGDSTSGGGGIAKVELLGSYQYWDHYPFDWRITDGGTNQATYLDIRFPYNTGSPPTRTCIVAVLNQWSSDQAYHPTFPFTNMGSTATSGRYVNMGGGAGWSKTAFTLNGSFYTSVQNNMVNSTQQLTAPTA